MCSVWRRYNALATGGDTGNASSAHGLTLISAHNNLVTSRYACSASLGHHSSGSVAEMVVTAVSATMLNIVGMIGTEPRLSVQTAAMKVQWCVSPINVLLTG